MAYKYTKKTTDVYVGTNDETLADKIKALNIKINKVLNPSSTAEPPDTFTSKVDNVADVTLTAVPIGDKYRLGIAPWDASSTLPNGGKASLGLYFPAINGTYSFSNRSLLQTNDNVGTAAFPILYNTPSTGIRIETMTFSDSVNSSNTMQLYKLSPILNGEVGNLWVCLGLLPTKEYFSEVASTTVYAGGNTNGVNGFHYYREGADSRHDVIFSGGTQYPVGDYAIASGVNLLSLTGINKTAVMYRHVVNDAVMYGIWINGTQHVIDPGSSMTISGSKFISIGNGYFVRIS